MPWQQHNPEIIWQEIGVSRTQQVRKQIWHAQDQQFQEVCFVRVYIASRQDLEDACDQLRHDHGPPRYQGAWWHDDRSIWLRESLATWWLLKNG